MRLVISIGRGWLNCLAWNVWARTCRPRSSKCLRISSCCFFIPAVPLMRGPMVQTFRGRSWPVCRRTPPAWAGWRLQRLFSRRPGGHVAGRIFIAAAFPLQPLCHDKASQGQAQNDRHEYNDSCHDWIPEENRAMERSVLPLSSLISERSRIFQRAFHTTSEVVEKLSFSKQRPQAELGYEEIRRI